MTMTNGTVIAQNGNATPNSASAAEPKAEPVKRKVFVKKPPPKRQESSIAFPYMDLDVAIGLAQAIMRAGGVALTREQLAGVMNSSSTSGTFLMKISAARNFGIVASVQNKYELTSLGFSVVDSDEKKQRAAMAEAFLNVPLYRRVYDEFKGKPLPPRPQGLEQAFISFGVAPKQAANARLAFDKSAKQAGFFAAGMDRLIEPIITSSERPKVFVDELDFRNSPGGSQGGAPNNPFAEMGRHPFIQGLLQTLPQPETVWSIEGRAKWLQAAAHCFDLIYKGSGEIQVTAKPIDETELSEKGKD